MWQVIVPALGAALAGLAPRSGQSRLPPRFATAVLTTVSALLALAITSAVVAVAVGFVLQVPQLAAGRDGVESSSALITERQPSASPPCWRCR